MKGAPMELFILVIELAGTMAFAASGAMTGMKKNMDIFGICIMALTTAVGGGVIRDMMAGDTPYIFVKHIYACASLAGALVCAALWTPAGEVAAMAVGMTVVMVIRLLSAHYRWNLPKAHD